MVVGTLPILFRTKRPEWLPVAITLVSLLLLVVLPKVLTISLPRLVVNFTKSEPRGIYSVLSLTELKRGELIFVSPSLKTQKFAKRTLSLNPERSLLKAIGAVSGDLVCVHHRALFINGKRVAPIYRKTRRGEVLPHIRGCIRIAPNYFLPLSQFSRFSLDGRYLGQMKVSLIEGKAKPVFTFD